MLATMRLICAFGLVAGALACSPAQRENIDKLERVFGIRPFYPNGELGETGYTDEFIAVASDLNCNFNTPDADTQAGDPTPSKVAAVCQWKNMDAGVKPALDDEQWYLFTKINDKPWGLLRPSAGRRNTPAKGDGFALTGGDGPIRLPALCSRYLDQCKQLAAGVADQDPGSGIDWVKICEDQCAPPPQSILYSSPLKCLETEATLSFDYWLLSSAKVQVLLLAQNTFDVVHEVDANSCTSRSPRDGRCTVKIPPQTEPFHLAIHGSNLGSKFVAIDNIEFDGELGDKCTYEEDPFDFGTTSTSLPSRPSTVITQPSDLNTNGGTDAQWQNSGAGEVDFAVHTGPVDGDKWTAATGDTAKPTGDFFMANGNEGEAELMSDVIDCQLGDGMLTFRAWTSQGTTLEVCVVDAVTLEEVYACDRIDTPMNGEPFARPIFGPLDDVRLLFRGSDWDNGAGGFVAIDDITYDAELCVGEPTEKPTDPDVIDQGACNNITTDFDEQTLATSKWTTYTDKQSIDVFDVRTHGIDNEFKPTANTAVRCAEDGSGKCAGVLVSRSKGLEVGVMKSAPFKLATDRYVEMRVRRGTWASMMYICIDSLPVLNPATGDLESVDTYNTQCKLVAGPDLTYDQYVNGQVAGAFVPKSAEHIYLVFTNPADSGAAEAGFLVDDIRLLRGTTGDSGALCQGLRA